MTKVQVAGTAGFCFGVERAVRLAVAALSDGPGPVYTLGPIIHNPQEVHRLEEMGLKMVDSLEGIEGGTVIIRSHGAPKGTVEAAEARGLSVVDATCPFVNRLKERVVELAGEGYQVVIVGDANHPEVMALLSFAPERCLVVSGVDDLRAGGRLKSRAGVVAQTTQSLGNLKAVACYCVEMCQEVKVFRTTCQATESRTIEAMELAGGVDVMIVVGGKNSANTSRLTEAVRRVGVPTFHVESAAEIQGLAIPADAVVGLTAGASTPTWVIEEIIRTLEEEGRPVSRR